MYLYIQILVFVIIIVIMIDIASELFTSSYFQTLHNHLNDYDSIY